MEKNMHIAYRKYLSLITFAILLFLATLVGCLPSKEDSPDGPDPVATEPQNFPDLAAGAGHTCLLTTTGRVECWGANQFGQLGGGDGSFTPLAEGPSLEGNTATDWVKTNIRGLPSKAIAITAGFYHTCALLDTGGVYCWGSNDQGQLGNGKTVNSSIPVIVLGLETGVKAIAAGAQHTCALLDDGSVQCWGDNSEGQLGNDTTQNSLFPSEVLDLPRSILQLTAGSVFTCALHQDETTFCWGNGQNGRFGDNLAEKYLTPIEVENLNGPNMALAAGDFHICVRTISNGVDCWGGLSSEQEFTPQNPFIVQGIPEGIVQLAPGGGHTCSLTTEDAVKCWGDNYFGQLGNGTDLGSWEPVIAMGLTDSVFRIASGTGHVCALLFDGSVRCWGDCSSGQCGDDTLTWNWNTYTHHKYHFSIDYPVGWNVMDVPNAKYPSEVDQVWFTQTSFPATESGARPEISLLITPDDPSPNWGARFFDNYKSEMIELQNIQATRISGMNKESHANEIVIIIQIEEYYIQALPNHSLESLRYFDQVMQTFNFDF